MWRPRVDCTELYRAEMERNGMGMDCGKRERKRKGKGKRIRSEPVASDHILLIYLPCSKCPDTTAPALAHFSPNKITMATPNAPPAMHPHMLLLPRCPFRSFLM